MDERLFKEFRFEDGGVLKLLFLDTGELSIHLQARHLGEGLKVTSAGVTLDAEKAREVVGWLASLLQEDSRE